MSQSFWRRLVLGPGSRRRRSVWTPESLEGRTLLTAYVVNTLSDSFAVDGVISLREAITASRNNVVSGDAPAGSTVDQDTIVFLKTLFTSGPQTMTIGVRFTLADIKITGPGPIDSPLTPIPRERFSTSIMWGQAKSVA